MKEYGNQAVKVNNMIKKPKKHLEEGKGLSNSPSKKERLKKFDEIMTATNPISLD